MSKRDNIAKAIANVWLRHTTSRDYQAHLRVAIATGLEAARLRAKETDCGVCGVPAFCMVEVCEGYAVPRCKHHRNMPAYQAESRLHSLLSLSSNQPPVVLEGDR